MYDLLLPSAPSVHSPYATLIRLCLILSGHLYVHVLGGGLHCPFPLTGSVSTSYVPVSQHPPGLPQPCPGHRGGYCLFCSLAVSSLSVSYVEACLLRP